jgi:hypothetical protein
LLDIKFPWPTVHLDEENQKCLAIEQEQRIGAWRANSLASGRKKGKKRRKYPYRQRGLHRRSRDLQVRRGGGLRLSKSALDRGDEFPACWF